MSNSTIKLNQLTTGTPGELITWSAGGSPVVVAVGDAGQVLMSNGPGAAPTFEDAPSGADGNGVYDGSDTIPTGTVASLQGTFQLGTGIQFTDTAATLLSNYIIGGATANNLTIGGGSMTGSIDIVSTNSSSAINLRPTGSGSITLGSGSSSLASGTRNLVTTAINFAPTSGTGQFHYFDISPTINQTGGASGTSRGIYINPTLTSAAN